MFYFIIVYKPIFFFFYGYNVRAFYIYITNSLYNKTKTLFMGHHHNHQKGYIFKAYRIRSFLKKLSKA